MAQRTRLIGLLSLVAVAGIGWAVSGRTVEVGPIEGDGGTARTQLRSVLRGLDIPEASQVLVYSKTSLQRDRISQSSPRAIYFNDRAAVGYVPGSPRLELAMVGSGAPGVSFYTLDLSAPEPTQPMRRGDECFQCHALPDAGGLQGLLMRSAGVRRSGDPNRCFEEIDDRTPFTLRWGGWYVTGARIPGGHAGRERLPRFDDAYLQSGSDVVALLVLGHQVAMTNLILRLGREMRLAASDLEHGQPPDSEAIRERVSELVDYMLFVNEVPLPAPVEGTSGFARAFETAGVRDAHGHTLRSLDLRRRLFRLPCSYMIHSPAFTALPADARAAVYARLSTILSGADTSPAYARLSTEDRRDIVHILEATVSDLPVDFGEMALHTM